MTETEFQALAEQTLTRIESALEDASGESELDVECSRSGNVLEIEFIASGSKVIVNSQMPMREMWVAARSGGFHYRYDNGKWINTRDQSELFAALSRIVSEQGGVPLILRA
ncbi:iron donor protein CyaY [Noviherbaspirillum saxi]|uniref:Iron-sulfur cluster assembly protein CyaY n=1 Tax=Noviherbaspirillum saxi TaxID=2320863 RepID=A0A3A3FYF2_9BURK|nr:iron donor protein CyaY [Noviherbaspirillum saxi]RJF99708.1 iron donor protein CyaY [Noviherbaspirillum saxi]